MTYSERNTAILNQLSPIVARKLVACLEEAEANDMDILLVSGFRTAVDQDKLYEQGRTTPGRIVTNARGGWSFHNFSVAADFVAIGMNGEPLWNDYRSFSRFAEIAMRYGFEWGDGWGDYGHLQYTQGLSIVDFRAGEFLQPETRNLAHFKRLQRFNEGAGVRILQRFKDRLKRKYPSIFNILFPSN